MTRRNLRIVRRVNEAPSIGICESCNAQFVVPAYLIGNKDEASTNLKDQFDKHKCKAVGISKNAARILEKPPKITDKP
jgi:hypothetical protein